VSIKHKRFITLTLGDTESWGWDEHTLPMLLQLVDSSKPDYRMSTHTGIVANYLTSPRALKAVEDVIAGAESLRESDSQFATLGIGLAEGELMAEFNWLGRLKTSRQRPMGNSLNDAVLVEQEPNLYQEVLQSLRESVYGCAV
jgi:hypothetical protein